MYHVMYIHVHLSLHYVGVVPACPFGESTFLGPSCCGASSVVADCQPRRQETRGRKECPFQREILPTSKYMYEFVHVLCILHLCTYIQYLTIIHGVSVCLFVRELLLQFACNRRQTPQSFSAAPEKYTKGVGVSF